MWGDCDVRNARIVRRDATGERWNNAIIFGEDRFEIFIEQIGFVFVRKDKWIKMKAHHVYLDLPRSRHLPNVVVHHTNPRGHPRSLTITLFCTWYINVLCMFVYIELYIDLCMPYDKPYA